MPEKGFTRALKQTDRFYVSLKTQILTKLGDRRFRYPTMLQRLHRRYKEAVGRKQLPDDASSVDYLLQVVFAGKIQKFTEVSDKIIAGIVPTARKCRIHGLEEDKALTELGIFWEQLDFRFEDACVEHPLWEFTAWRNAVGAFAKQVPDGRQLGADLGSNRADFLTEVLRRDMRFQLEEIVERVLKGYHNR